MTKGERIKQCRLERGMTQKDLAEKMGISPIGISQYETGKRVPKGETIARIADALGADPIYLSTGVRTFDLLPGLKGFAEYQKKQNELLYRCLTSEPEFESDKGTRLSCKIDSWLYDVLAEVAEENQRTIEDEIEARLYKSIMDEMHGRTESE